LSSPYREALNQRNKKIERKKADEFPEKYSPVFFWKRTQFVSRVSEFPLSRNAQKNTHTHTQNRTYVLFFASWRRFTLFSRFVFSATPCISARTALENQPQQQEQEQQQQQQEQQQPPPTPMTKMVLRNSDRFGFAGQVLDCAKAMYGAWFRLGARGHFRPCPPWPRDLKPNRCSD
jgi:hypothetical protein